MNSSATIVFAPTRLVQVQIPDGPCAGSHRIAPDCIMGGRCRGQALLPPGLTDSLPAGIRESTPTSDELARPDSLRGRRRLAPHFAISPGL